MSEMYWLKKMFCKIFECVFVSERVLILFESTYTCVFNQNDTGATEERLRAPTF